MPAPFPPEGETCSLRIDPNAVGANWTLMKSVVAPHVRVGAVVKADAYGCGARPVFPALLQAGCRDFFVAVLGEALDLRDLVPVEGRIFVLSGPPPGAETAFVDHGLIPVLNSVEQIDRWYAATGKSPAPCVWHVDTGMTRLGVDLAEMSTLVPSVTTGHRTAPVLLMSHLACADDPGHPLNRQQLDVFRQARALLPDTPGSLSASGGVFLGPEYHQDMVRPGIALYGGNPLPNTPLSWHPVARLRAKILQIREIDTQKSVGYGATAPLKPGQRLATVGLGYADGYPRSASNRAFAFLGGLRLPVVGRVSMDLITLDVSAVPEGVAKPGVLVDMLGSDYTINDLGEAAGTISYEILTRLKPRCRVIRGPLYSPAGETS